MAWEPRGKEEEGECPQGREGRRKWPVLTQRDHRAVLLQHGVPVQLLLRRVQQPPLLLPGGGLSLSAPPLLSRSQPHSLETQRLLRRREGWGSGWVGAACGTLGRSCQNSSPSCPPPRSGGTEPRTPGFAGRQSNRQMWLDPHLCLEQCPLEQKIKGLRGLRLLSREATKSPQHSQMWAPGCPHDGRYSPPHLAQVMWAGDVHGWAGGLGSLCGQREPSGLESLPFWPL